jgi:hypothetical protein
MLHVSTLCDAADVKSIIHFRPYPPQRDGAFCATQAPVTLQFFIQLLYAVLRRRVLSELGSKTSLIVTIDCVQAYSSTQNAFSARVAIFTQPAPLAATDVTKHPRHVQNKLGEFSFYRYVACYHPLRHSSVPIFCNVPGNYE